MRTLIVAASGWLALAVCSYLTFPIFGVLSVFGWLVIGACWLWAVIASVTAIASLVRQRMYPWAAVAAGAVVLAAIGVWTADWATIYVRSQLWLHRDTLKAVADGGLATDGRLPWQIRYLSVDGKAHPSAHGTAVYLPMWQDWRGEAGGGIVHLSQAPDARTLVVTAPGGVGHPERYLGDGWWWVEDG